MSDNINEIKDLVGAAYGVAKKDYILTSFIFAFLMAVVRVARDQSEPTIARRMLEATICGLLTVTAALGLQAAMLGLGIAPERIPPMMYAASLFMGGAIGNLGSQWTRAFARRIALVAEKKLTGGRNQ